MSPKKLISLAGLVLVFTLVSGETPVATAEDPQAPATPAAAPIEGAKAAEGAKGTEVAANSTKAPEVVSVPERLSSECIVDEAAVQDLKKRRDELESRSKELSARESDIKAKERALEDEMKKITTIRDEINATEALKAKGAEERVAKLVETVETMSPKAASQMLASMDETLAVSTMSKMSTPKLAKVMNLMDSSKSTHLSELMAGVVRARKLRSASDDVAVTTPVTKGGENNGNTSEPNRSASPDQQSSRKPGSTEK